MTRIELVALAINAAYLTAAATYAALSVGFP